MKQPEDAGDNAFIVGISFKLDELGTGGIDIFRRFHQKIAEEFVHYAIRAAVFRARRIS
jgi:hypothetical protein